MLSNEISLKTIILCLFSISFLACQQQDSMKNTTLMNQKSNPAVYFEIPVSDMPRAIDFYKNVFNFTFETEYFDNNEMAYFPFSDGQSGISGALAKGEIYKPTKNGVLIYFNTNNIELSLEKAQSQGSEILFPATFHKELGFAVAEIQDSEGNRIGLHQKLK